MPVPFSLFFERVRLATAIETQQELAAVLGVNRSAVTQAKKRDAVPDKWLLALSRAYGLNPDWLERGEGVVQGAPRIQTSSVAGNDPLEQAGMDAFDEFARVPKVQAMLCAGGGSFETELGVKEYYAFRRNWLERRGDPARMVLMDVTGNSMEPEIKEGDTVLIDQSQGRIIAGGVFALGIEDTVMIKRVEKQPGALILHSDNTDYSSIRLMGEELDQVRIIGKLIWIAREYR